jgi:hypothetical protein
MARLDDNGIDLVAQLQGLGLLDRFEDFVEPTQSALKVNDLARPKAGHLLDSERTEYASLVLPSLFTAWGGTDGQLHRPYSADIVLTQLGLIAQDHQVLEACAENAVAGLQESFAYQEAADLGQKVIVALEQAGQSLPANLFRFTGESCVTIGAVDVAEQLYEKGLSAIGQAQQQGRAVNALDRVSRRTEGQKTSAFQSHWGCKALGFSLT